MLSTYRCPNPNCAETVEVADSSNSVTMLCPFCGTPSPPFSQTDLIERTRTLSNRRDVTVVPEPPVDDSHRATMSLPQSQVDDSHRATMSLSGASNRTPLIPRAGETREIPPPEKVGRFKVQSKLGEGAFGVVYRAFDPLLDRLVALKVAKPGSLETEEKRERFLLEAKAAANLRHPNIVPLYEIGSEGDQLYLCSALIEGRTLEAWIQEAGEARIPLEEAVRITRKLAEALAYAHRNGVIHRDVKPQNVLVDAALEPHLTDFGLAARETTGSGPVTQDGLILGTPAYLAPEQAEGASEAASDQYSLGCAFFEMLTGLTPFSGGPAQQIFLHKNEPPPKPRGKQPSIPRDLDSICLKTLSKSPRDRYLDCDELAEDLKRFTRKEPTLARPPGRLERVAKWALRSPFQAATLLAVLGLIAAVIVVIYGRAKAAEQDAELQRTELREKTRLDGVRQEFNRLLQQSSDLANQKTLTGEQWSTIERDTTVAIRLMENEETLKNEPLLKSAQDLRDRARSALVDAQERQRVRSVLNDLRSSHANAVFYGSEYSGLSPAENEQRCRAEISKVRRWFKLELDQTGPPALDPKFFPDPAERKLVADRCCELLLLEADLLSRPRPGEPIERFLAEVQLAMQTLQRAESLFDPPEPTRSGLEIKARCLGHLQQPAEAEQARKLAEQTEPKLVSDRVLQSLNHYREREFKEATALLSSALREQPDHFGAEYLLAICRLQTQRIPEAREGLTRCLEQRPDFTSGRLLRAFASILLNQFTEAQSDLEAVLKQPELDESLKFVALVNRGVLNLNRKQSETAIQDFREAIRVRPNATSAYLNLAVTYLKRPELKRSPTDGFWSGLASDLDQSPAQKLALATLDEGIQNCPPNPRLFHERGQLRLKIGDFRGAQEDFRSAVGAAVSKRDPILADDLIQLGQLLVRDNQAPEAVRAYELALAIRPDRIVAHRLLAQARLKMNQPDLAREALDRYLEAIPLTPGKAPTPEQAQILAQVYAEKGKALEAQAKAYRTRGLLDLLENDLRNSIDSYTHSLKFTRDSDTLSLRGWAYMLFNSPELAQIDFDEATKLAPREANGWIGRANARVRLGKTKEAILDVEEGLRLAGDDPRHLYNAARVFSLAVPPIRKNATPPPKTPETTQHATWERRAAQLLRKILEAKPEDERVEFWREYVEKDRAFENIRNGSLMLALKMEYDRLMK